ncbi:uncharacterized protein LOC129305193 [Prosopis cineraria]|uniref:uncharacterized protein LOC129305193 n=1 Tax=Prosopis cineraria TaxID=364024 RepID=UPI0024104F49|nr:uncharacterized protein LOC129305193 [Prosopis cineraria]
MEAPQTEGIATHEQGNKTKNQVTFSAGRGGGGIAGLLVFGGALAVTGLIAVASFVNQRNKARPPPHEPQQSDGTPRGIPCLLHSAANHDNARYETSTTRKDRVDLCESLPGQSLILEDEPGLEVKTYVEEENVTSLHQEIVLSDHSPPESTVSFNDNGTGEEALGSSVDGPCFEDVARIESREPLKSVGINEVQHDNDYATTETEDDIVEEDDDVAFKKSENSSEATETATEETEDDIVEEDDDVAFETSGNSSEATGRTSLDSSEAAIWPAELIEEEPQQVKGKMVNDQGEAEGTAESNIPPRYDQSHGGASGSEFSDHAGNDRVMASAKTTSSEKPNLYVALNYHLSAPKFKASVILLLLFAFLILVLLTHRNRTSGMVAIL